MKQREDKCEILKSAYDFLKQQISMFEKTYSLFNEWREDGGYDPQSIIHGIFFKNHKEWTTLLKKK